MSRNEWSAEDAKTIIDFVRNTLTSEDYIHRIHTDLVVVGGGRFAELLIGSTVMGVECKAIMSGGQDLLGVMTKIDFKTYRGYPYQIWEQVRTGYYQGTHPVDDDDDDPATDFRGGKKP